MVLLELLQEAPVDVIDDLHVPGQELLDKETGHCSRPPQHRGW